MEAPQDEIIQYLDSQKLKIDAFGADIKPTKDNLISADTYNESKLLLKIKEFETETINKLILCAINISVLGSGNQSYGKIRYNDVVYEITEIFRENNVKYNENINMKYDDDQLTARRLVRLCRYIISDFIIENERPSYLWIKYANKTEGTQKFKYCCFPGAENMIVDKECALFLINTYKNVDRFLNKNTKFSERIIRTFVARGIIDPTIEC